MREPDTVVILYDFGFINGGQAKVAIDEALGLVAAGLRVIYFAAVGPMDSRLEAAGIETVCLGRHDLLSNPSKLDALTSNLWSRQCAAELRKLLTTLDPARTVLHTHGWPKSLSPSIAPVIEKSGFRHVYTMHEFFLACPNGAFYDFQRNELCHRQPLGLSCLSTHCDSRARLHKAWRVVRQGVLYGIAHWPQRLKDIIYISETQLRVLRPYLAKDARLYNLPNPNMQAQGERVPAEKNDVFLFIGRLAPEKGCALFAEAARKAGARAVFVGEGPEMATIARINPEAELRGWLKPEEVQDALSKARALVFSSLWYETFGLAPIEALSRGVPVICGAWSAATEMVDHDVGITLDSRDVNDWATAITQLRGDNALVEQKSRAAHQRNFSEPIDVHIESLREIYRGLGPVAQI